jgi:hypothetical protein
MNGRRRKAGATGAWRRQDGAALITSLFILVVLTFIGLQAILTSSTEVILSANYKRSKEAFYSAEGALEYVVRDKQYFLVLPGGDGMMEFPDDTGVSLDAGFTSANGTVTFVSRGAPPVGSGTSMGRMQADYFVIDSTGTGSLGSRSQQRLLMTNIVPGGI